jgi:hypothetical protein
MAKIYPNRLSVWIPTEQLWMRDKILDIVKEYEKMGIRMNESDVIRLILYERLKPLHETNAKNDLGS